VHAHDGDQPGPERRGGNERWPILQEPGESAAQEPERLEGHDRHARERECQRCGRLVLERYLLAGDRDRFRVPGQVELHRARQRDRLPGSDLPRNRCHILNRQERDPK